MTDVATEDRLARLEERLLVVEEAIRRAEAMFEAFAKGPGKKILAMFGGAPP